MNTQATSVRGKTRQTHYWSNGIVTYSRKGEPPQQEDRLVGATCHTVDGLEYTQVWQPSMPKEGGGYTTPAWVLNPNHQYLPLWPLCRYIFKTGYGDILERLKTMPGVRTRLQTFVHMDDIDRLGAQEI